MVGDLLCTVGFIFTNRIKTHKMLGLIGFRVDISEWANFVYNLALGQTDTDKGKGHRDPQLPSVQASPGPLSLKSNLCSLPGPANCAQGSVPHQGPDKLRQDCSPGQVQPGTTGLFRND